MCRDVEVNTKELAKKKKKSEWVSLENSKYSVRRFLTLQTLSIFNFDETKIFVFLENMILREILKILP